MQRYVIVPTHFFNQCRLSRKIIPHIHITCHHSTVSCPNASTISLYHHGSPPLRQEVNGGQKCHFKSELHRWDNSHRLELLCERLRKQLRRTVQHKLQALTLKFVHPSEIPLLPLPLPLPLPPLPPQPLPFLPSVPLPCLPPSVPAMRS